MSDITRLTTHPLALTSVTTLLDGSTGTAEFRKAMHNLSRILIGEAVREVAKFLTLEEREVKTPLEPTQGVYLNGDAISLVPVLSAGLGMLWAGLELLPAAPVHLIGLVRDSGTGVATCHYVRAPVGKPNICFVLEPMEATGGSASDAVTIVKGWGAQQVVCIGVNASPQGVERMRGDHPDVPFFFAKLGSGLTKEFYIKDGVGDAGDRWRGLGKTH